MTNQTSQSAVATGPPAAEALLSGRNKKVAAARAMLNVVRLAGPQKWTIVFFIALYFLASFVQMSGLYCFNAGFTLVTKTDQASGRGAQLVTKALEMVHLPATAAWIVFFGAFILLGIVAAAIDHGGRVIRLKMLSAYEAEQMKRGLTLICDADPREIANISPREMVLALRSDCKAMRIILQSVLGIVVSLVQTVFPFALIFTMDVNMSLTGLGFLLAGFYPVYLLGKKAGKATFERQNVSLAAGAQVSGMITGLQSGGIAAEDKGKLIESIQLAIADQHKLWRQQYQIRSLCEKIPTLFSLLGTFAILIFGVMRINQNALTWPNLMTFLLATRVVFGPFPSIGNRSAKASENVLRAARHLEFIRHFRNLKSDGSVRQPLPRVGQRTSIDSVEVRDLVLPQRPQSKLPPLSFTLRPGSILTLMDPVMSLRNPLYQFLSGVRVVRNGQVLLNGRDINTVRYDSIQDGFSMLRIVGDNERPGLGTVLECMQTLQPGLTRPEAERFALATVGPTPYRLFPKGLDTHLCFALKKKDGLPISCYRVVNLFCKHVEGKSVQVVDAFEGDDEATWAMLEGYVRTYSDRCIYLWMDRRFRQDLPRQHIVVFNKGLYQGDGDLKWFEQRFPDWNDRIQAADAVDERTDNLVLAEAADQEEEEAEDEEEG